jgi:hypothetical protein
VSVGWGDRRFYMESGVSPARALDGLRALFAPHNPAVIMLEPLQASPDRLWRTGVLRLTLSQAGFARLAERVDRSFRLERGQIFERTNGRPERFYDSVETFSVLHLCNHWTGEALNAAGVPVRPVLDTWGSGLALDLRTGAARVGRP